jgi:chromosome segregation ATPase
MNEREQLMAQLKDLAKQATASPDHLAEKNKEIVLLKASNREQLIALQSEITSLQSTVVKVETSSANEKKALLTRLDEYEEQIGGNLNDIRSRLKEHDSLKARLSQSGEFENRMVKALEERDQANENLRTLATAVEQMRAQNKKLETDLTALDEQKEAANERIKLLATEQSQVAGMRQQLEAAQSMVLRQKTDLGRQQRLNDKLALAVDGDNKAKTELMAVSQKASKEIAQQKKVNVELALTLEAATKDRNTLAQQVEAQSALLAQMKAQVPSPEANQRMNVLQEENARLSNELQSLEAQLVQSELKVQDLVIQQQEVLIRLKRLLSAANE